MNNKEIIINGYENGFDNDILVEYYNDVTEDIRYIRETVFVLEQGFSEEFDEIDKKSIHLLVKVNNKRAATARIFKSDNSNAKDRKSVV